VGIGKTALIDMFTLKWAKEEILKEKKVDFLFGFSCRELNRIDGKMSLKELFEGQFPEIFSCISIEELGWLSSRVLIVIDGLDELQGIYNKDEEDPTRLKLVCDLIDVNGSLLNNHKSIVCGRHRACEFIKCRFRESRNVVKSIEVCGFNSENVEQYIEHFFASDEDTSKAKQVLDIIKNSNDLLVMASVPVFLWIMCNIYSEDLVAQDIQSKTELYLYTCLVFMKNHMRAISNLIFEDLFDLVSNEEFLKILKTLALLSLQTYMDHKVLFHEEDFQNLDSTVTLEKTGLIVKSNWKGIHMESVYQFKHLVLQEFLCSLYLNVTKNIKPYLSNHELASCTPMLLGVDALRNEKSNPLFNALFNNLEMAFDDRRKFGIICCPFLKSPDEMYKEYILNKRAELTVPTSMISGEELVVNHLSPECMEFLNNVYESKYVNTQGKKFEGAFLFIDIVSTRLVLHLMNILNIRRCSYLYYSKGITLNNSAKPEIPKDLLKLVVTSESADSTQLKTVIEHVGSMYLLIWEGSTLHLNCESMLSLPFPEEILKLTNSFDLDISTQVQETWRMPFLQDLLRHILESDAKTKKKLCIKVNEELVAALRQYLCDNFTDYSTSINIVDDDMMTS